MEPMNTSRRNFLRLVGLGVPVSVALVACGGEPEPDRRRQADPVAARVSRRTGRCPASRRRRSARTRSRGSTRRTRRRRSDDALRQRRLQAEGEDRDRCRQGPHADLGLGRRWPEELRRRRPGRRHERLLRPEPRPQGQDLSVRVRGGDGRRQALRDADRDRGADRAVLEQEDVRPVGAEPPQSWGDIMDLVRSSTTRGSRRSRSPGSRCGRT